MSDAMDPAVLSTTTRVLVSETAWFEGLPRPDRWYPVAVEFTETRIVFVEADSQAEAVEYAKDDGDLGGDWEHAERTDWTDFGPADGWKARHVIESWRGSQDEAGPREACPVCCAVADYARQHGLRFARHDGSCPYHVHLVHISAAFGGGADRGIIGWRPECSCGVTGFERTTVRGDEPDQRPHYEKRSAIQLARAHAVGRPHRKDVALGLPGRDVPVETIRAGA